MRTEKIRSVEGMKGVTGKISESSNMTFISKKEAGVESSQ